ncbi:MAG: cytochrome c [Rhodospirillaceae bacterium]|nr:cytochrome c [Rhodospirillaceae bacterium]MCA8934374.1 cytochrome c [Rhodospirillaceae bacterium]
MKSLSFPLVLAVAGFAAPALADDDQVARGAYLVSIMDCTGCHTGRMADGAPDPNQYLTGATIGFEMPDLGIFWPPNLTSDPTGIGDWSDEEVATAIRTGERPDGRILAPIMPWMSYASLTDDDVAALVAYLRTLPPTENEVPAPVASGAEAVLPYFAFAVPQ